MHSSKIFEKLFLEKFFYPATIGERARSLAKIFFASSKNFPRPAPWATPSPKFAPLARTWATLSPKFAPPARTWATKSPICSPQPVTCSKFSENIFKIFKNKNKFRRKRRNLFLFLKILKIFSENFSKTPVPGVFGSLCSPIGLKF